VADRGERRELLRPRGSAPSGIITCWSHPSTPAALPTAFQRRTRSRRASYASGASAASSAAASVAIRRRSAASVKRDRTRNPPSTATGASARASCRNRTNRPRARPISGRPPNRRQRMEIDEDTIDLRSDTVTTPSEAMREAARDAEVGDDVYRDDPTVNEVRAPRRRCGRHRGPPLYVPSGTMANQIAVHVHTERTGTPLRARVSHLPVGAGGRVEALGHPDPNDRCGRSLRPDARVGPRGARRGGPPPARHRTPVAGEHPQLPRRDGDPRQPDHRSCRGRSRRRRAGPPRRRARVQRRGRARRRRERNRRARRHRHLLSPRGSARPSARSSPATRRSSRTPDASASCSAAGCDRPG